MDKEKLRLLAWVALGWSIVRIIYSEGKIHAYKEVQDEIRKIKNVD